MNSDDLPNKPDDWFVLWSAKTDESILWTQDVLDQYELIDWELTLKWAVANTTERLEKLVCPECRDGKHPNCTGWALGPNDDLVECNCKDEVHNG